MRATALLALLPMLPALAADPPAPVLKWRASVWALGAVTDKESPDGSTPFRPMDARNGGFALDGLQLGADADLGSGWTLKATLIGGRNGRLLQEFAGETGTVGLSEAMLIWTRGADTFKIGRMWTFMGMESCDLTAAIPASHGLLATYPLPFGQVGIQWHHAFSPSWATDLWVTNGEDRNTDNNRGKTVGANLSYNHGGAADKFLNLSAFTGPEQDAHGPQAVPGAEGRRRTRLSHGGQWTWGKVSLAWEGEFLRETLPSAWVAGAAGSTADGTLKALGTWLKVQATPVWSGYLRLEQIQDDLGFRLNWDPSVQAARGMRVGADITMRAASLGLERKLGPGFMRAELRHDRMNHDLLDRESKAYRGATSATVAVGVSFSQ